MPLAGCLVTSVERQELGLTPELVLTSCRLRHLGLLPCVGGSPDRKVLKYGRRARHEVAEYFVAALVSALLGA